jgi:GNAT superfamily N-acetyltransferase
LFATPPELCDRFSMLLRERTEADLDACVQLADATHEIDRYPMRRPDDLRQFVVTPDALAAWVAVEEGEIIGHVALRPRSSDAVIALATEALCLPADRLGVVSRLLVSPRHRRHGVGRSLLEVASREAHERGLWPILDVLTYRQEAISLYDKCGWLRAGQVMSRFGDGREVEELVYLGPGGAQ